MAERPRTTVEELVDWVRLLTDEAGPRRPTSNSERIAANLVRERLRGSNVDCTIERFDGYSTFAAPYGAAMGLALGGAGPLGAALSAAEDRLLQRPLSRLLARRRSQNVVATIEPGEERRRTLCLVSHLDSSRSGFMFSPLFLPLLHPFIALQAGAMATLALSPLLKRSRPGRRALLAGRAIVALSLALLLERELRGEDVPGANDNASGVAVVGALATELAAAPLRHTRVIALFTGCEEAGALGAEAFLRSRIAREGLGEVRRWLFLNFDGVGAPATLRYLREEGVLRKWSADPLLCQLAQRLADERPELGLEGTDRNAGLTYDATPVLARDGRALTISAQDGTIPNYHSPADTTESLDRDVLASALEVGRELAGAIDRGGTGA